MSISINLMSPHCVLHCPIWESERWLRKETYEPNQIILSTTPCSSVIFFFHSGCLLACVIVQHKNTYKLYILPCVPFPSPEDLPDSRDRIHISCILLHWQVDSSPLSYLGSPHCSIGLSISLFPKHLAHDCKSGFFQVRTGVLFAISENKDVIVFNDSSPPMWADESQGHSGRRKIPVI